MWENRQSQTSMHEQKQLQPAGSFGPAIWSGPHPTAANQPLFRPAISYRLHYCISNGGFHLSWSASSPKGAVLIDSN
jgi:hypothetical protein